VQSFLSCLRKEKCEFNFQYPTMFVFLVSRKSGLIKRCSSCEELSSYKMSWSHVDWCTFCNHLISLNVPPSTYSKSPLKKITIQIKLVGMPMIFYCTKPRFFYKCNGAWVIVSVKQNVNYNFQPPAMFVVLFQKSYLKSFIWRPTSIQNFLVPRRLVQGSHPPQKFECHPFCNGWKYIIKIMALRSPSMASPLYWIS
jgi:hypothetical protein